MDSREFSLTDFAPAPDILALAIAARTDHPARWQFAMCAQIQDLITREVRRRTRNFHDREDLESEARAGIVEEFQAGGVPDFASEERVLGYWALRVRRVIDRAIRHGGNARYEDGAVVRPEVTAGSRADMDEAIYAARNARWILRVAEKPGFSQEESALKYRRLEMIREFLSAYPDQRAVRHLLKRLVGRDARRLVDALDLVRPDRSRIAYQRVYSDLLNFLFAQGEEPVVGKFGAFVQAGQVSGVVHRDGRVVDAWTVKTQDYSGFLKMTRRLRRTLDTGVGAAVVNALEWPTDEAVLVRHALWGRGVPCETVDLNEAIQGRATEPDGPIGLPGSVHRRLKPGERIALGLALAGSEGALEKA